MGHSRRRFIRGCIAFVAVASRLTPALGARPRNKAPEPLFADDFSRPDRPKWGRGWFNQRYERFFEIDRGRGMFRLPPTVNNAGYRPNPVLVLDHDVSDVDIRVALSMTNPRARAGIVARATGYGDYYAAYVAPDGLRISRCTPHDEIPLTTAETWFDPGRRYRMRVQVRGLGPVVVRAKVWQVGKREPLLWQAKVVDADPGAITTKGAFGMFFAHPLDRLGSRFRVLDFVARSAEQPSTTAPTIAYSFAGPPKGTKVKLVAKTAVPATIAFETSRDPAFNEIVEVIGPKRTTRAQTAKAAIDISSFAPSSFVYWRPIAERRGHRIVGPTHSFRTPPANGMPVRFAFGSCTRWEVSPHTSFEQARLKLPDLYLHQGDFGYVRSKVPTHSRDAYQDHWVRMLMDPSVTAMTREVPFAWMRDDADYGKDAANRHTLRPFTIGAHEQLNANPGQYFETRLGDVAIFSIDCRRYSTGIDVPEEERSKLGDAQKAWLKTAMTQAAEEGIALLVLSSPQGFGSDSRNEAWRRRYRAEWQELVDFFVELDAPVLIVSGDHHGHRLHEYPSKELPTDVPKIVEIVSSGTEQNKFFDEDDPEFILRKAKGSGFGLVEVGAEHEVDGRRTRTLTISAVRTKDGTPFWTETYTIVTGVGFLSIEGD